MKKRINSQPITASATQTQEVNFRSKFETLIPEGLREKFAEAIRSMNKMENEEAFNLLWLLTYNPEAGIQKFGFTSIDPASVQAENIGDENDEAKYESTVSNDLTFISDDIVRTFRNELRYQRTLVHKDFRSLVEVEVPESCKEAYKALYSATGGDVTTSVVAFEACLTACRYFDKQSIRRSLALLGNPKEQNSFGGIRSLAFSYDEANYLKPYAVQLHDLLSALWKEKKVHDDFPNLPLAGIGQMLKEKGVVLTDTHEVSAKPVENAESSTETDVPTESNEAFEPEPDVDIASQEITPQGVTVTPVTAAAVLENAGVFEYFLETYVKFEKAKQMLQHHGFDPTEVASKADAILKGLDAFKLLG